MELTEIGALELGAMIAARKVSAVEVMRAALDRIAAVNSHVNAVVSLADGDALLTAAEEKDRALKADGPSGPLHGIPVAVKDLANVAGFPTSMGSPITAGQVARADDLPIARMRAAGAVFIGKTNTPEFGLGSHTFNPVHGATRNPYDPTRSAGGSSGGAAVALSARMQWVCDGSDMMGSLRNPAGWNNVYGFRPSWGRVPPEPGGDVVLHPLSTLGPMARDVEDLAMLMDVMGGPDPRAPLGPPAETFSGRLSCDLKGCRIAWGGDWGGAWPMEAGLMAASEAALSAFADMGCEVDHITPPMDAEEIFQSWVTLRAFAVAGRIGPVYARAELRPKLRDVAIWEVERGLALTPQQILQASAVRTRWHVAAADLFSRYDALVLPTAQCWPFPVDTSYPTEIAGQAMDTYHRWMECVVPASLLGLPALGVPGGFGENGLPFGFQIIGPYGGDLDILRIGQGWHSATGWPQKRPPLF